MTWDMENIGYLLTLENSSTAVHTLYFHVLGMLIKGTSYVFSKNAFNSCYPSSYHENSLFLLIYLFTSLQLVEHPSCVGYSSNYFIYATDHNLISLLEILPTLKVQVKPHLLHAIILSFGEECGLLDLWTIILSFGEEGGAVGML